MELTADLVDWEWASSAPSPEVFCFEMLEDDEVAEAHFGPSCFDLPGGWSMSTRAYYDIGDALPEALVETGAPPPEVEAWLDLLVPSRLPDDLGLRTVEDEGYIGSISPARVAGLSARIGETSSERLARAVSRAPGSKAQDAESVRVYLDQWRGLLAMAARSGGMGVLIHMG